MSNFLIKTFIKDSENIKDGNVRERYGILASVVGIICNIILFLVKLVIGITINSISIIADSFNNLSDSASSLVSLIGFKVANKPADAEHPFGHGRVEYISSLIVSFIIMLLGYEFLKTSFKKILIPEKMEFAVYSLVFLFSTILVKLWLSKLNKKIGNKIYSNVLIASSQDALNDCLVTGVTIFSMIFNKLTGLNIDGYAGVAVACVIIYTGISMAKGFLSTLIGESSGGGLEALLKAKILEYDGVLGCHDLIVHNYGPNRNMATIHVEVPSQASIEHSHEIIDKIERDLSIELGIYLVVHMDPVNLNDERIINLGAIIDRVLNEHSEKLEAHDFRIVNSKGRCNFIFDLEVPHSYSVKSQKNLVEELKKAVQQYEGDFQCIINIESGFVNRDI